MNKLRLIVDVLNSRQKRAAVILLLLMVVGMLFETISIGLIVPIAGLLMNDQLLVNYPIMQSAISLLDGVSKENYLLYSVMLLALIYTIKVIYLSYMILYQNTFVYKIQASLSQKIFDKYIRQPYTFHLQRNSAQLIRNITNNTGNFAASVMAMGNMIAELLVLCGVFLLLVFIEPYGAIFVLLLLSVVAYLYYVVTRSRVRTLGERKHIHEGFRIQHIQQGIGAIKDIKLLGREKVFLEQYAKHNEGSANVGKNNSIINTVPRLWFELVVMYGLVVLIIVMLNQSKSVDIMIPTISLFIVAAFRLMPSINRILFSMQTIRFSEAVIMELHHEIKELEDVDIYKSEVFQQFNSSIVFSNVEYIYPEAKGASLHDVNITLHKGKSYGVIGHSGAGKSTFVDLVLGLLKPTDGNIFIDGHDLQNGVRSWQDNIGYVPQNIYLTDDTIRNNIAFGLPDNDVDDELVIDSVQSAQLTEYINSLPDGLNTIVGERGVRLSGGQKQRIGIARALYHKPSVLVLDEATSALDNITEIEFIKSVRNLKDKTVMSSLK